MKYVGIGLMYAAFYSAIGVACWITKSGCPLVALIFTPSFKSKSSDSKNDSDD
jgi:hypothetical protein